MVSKEGESAAARVPPSGEHWWGRNRCTPRRAGRHGVAPLPARGAEIGAAKPQPWGRLSSLRQGTRRNRSDTPRRGQAPGGLPNHRVALARHLCPSRTGVGSFILAKLLTAGGRHHPAWFVTRAIPAAPLPLARIRSARTPVGLPRQRRTTRAGLVSRTGRAPRLRRLDPHFHLATGLPDERLGDHDESQRPRGEAGGARLGSEPDRRRQSYYAAGAIRNRAAG